MAIKNTKAIYEILALVFNIDECVYVCERERERDSIFFISVCFAIWNVCIIKKEIRLGGLLWSIPNVG